MKFLSVLFMVVFSFITTTATITVPESLNHDKAVERIEEAKEQWVQKREPSEKDTPPFIIINDYLDLRNTQNYFIRQRLIIVR